MLRKKILPVLLLFALLLSLAPAPAMAAQAPEKVKVGYFIHDGYQNKGSDGSYSGYSYDYLQKIATYANLQYEFVQGTWTQCLEWLQDGTIDMVGFMQKTDAREAIYDFPDWNCGYNTSKLLTLKDNTALAQNAWGEFDGISVGFVQGSQIIQQFAQLAEKEDFQYTEKLYATQAEVTAALQNGEVDAICVSNVVIPEWARVLSVFDPQPIYYAVTKGNTALLDKLNYAMGEIKTGEPTFEQSLRAKYYKDNRSDAVVFSQAEKDYIANSKPLTVALDPDLLPVEGLSSKTGQVSGFTPELLLKISQLSGLQFTYQTNSNYADAIKNFEKGQYDILSGVNQSFENFDSSTLSDVFLRVSVVLVGEGTVFDSTARPLKIATVPRTAFLEEYVKMLYPDCELVSYNTVPESLEAVEKQKANLALVNLYSFQTQKFLEYSNLNIVYDTGRLSDYRFAYHADAPEELVSIMNKCINSISESESNNMLTTAISSSMEVKNSGWKTFFSCAAIALALGLAASFFIRLRKSRKKLERQAYYDELTGTSNLAKFTMDAKELILQNPQLHYTIRVFDISNFQMFNDFYGFKEGNTLLCGVVKALSELLDKKTETLGRINADQFITLTANDTTPTEYALRITDFRARFFPNDGPHAYQRVSFKTGCYTLEKGDEEVSQAIEKAILAHKTAKLLGKRVVYYDDAMKKEAQRIQEIENKMDDALANEEFKLYLQPQYKISSGRIIGLEALCRWQPKDGALIFPSDFIPVFEKNGFIVKLDYYMFELVCKTLRAWLDDGAPVRAVSVNLSRLHLENENLVAELCEIADAYMVPHGLLELELTEAVAMKNEEVLHLFAQQFHEAGMRLSIDDFGSGYSSLGILNALPFDTLKLDRSFFTPTADSACSQVIIQSIVQMSQELKITTIAEGIEKEEQVAFLKKINCDAVQGYYYAKPMPAAAIVPLLFEKK